MTAASESVEIMLSTWPVLEGSYAIDTGTSMATPYVAGCIALLMEARGKGKVTPAEIKSLLSTTANPNVFHDGVTASPFLGSVAQQGGGLIDAYKLVHTTTKFNVSTISFNDTEHIAPAYIRINNTGSYVACLHCRPCRCRHRLHISDQQLHSSGEQARQFCGPHIPMAPRSSSAHPACSSLLVAPAVLKVTATPPKGLDSRPHPRLQRIHHFQRHYL